MDDILAYAVTARSNYFLCTGCFEEFYWQAKRAAEGTCPKCKEIVRLKGWPGTEFIRGLRDAKRAREQHEI